MILLLFSVCLASEPKSKYFSKGLKVFTQLIATDLEKDDFLEIMNYIGLRFHHNCYNVANNMNCDATMQILLQAIDQQQKQIQKLSAKLVEDKEQLRNEISQTKLDLAEECSNIANASKVRDGEIQEAMVEQYNQFKQALCDLDTFESCLSGECCISQAISFPNLALGKTAWQSSDHYSDAGKASAAVDGDRNGVFWKGNSCFHTKIENHPWWMVDLGAEKRIGRVVMVNRDDASYTRLRNIVVSVRSEKDENGVICGTFEGPGSKGQVITITCPEEIRGRFVKLTMNSRNYFHLCEVEVYRQ